MNDIGILFFAVMWANAGTAMINPEKSTSFKLGALGEIALVPFWYMIIDALAGFSMMALTKCNTNKTYVRFFAGFIFFLR